MEESYAENSYARNDTGLGDIGSHWLDFADFISGCRVKDLCADFATFHPARQKPLKPIEAYAGKILAAQDYQPVPVNTKDYAAVLFRFEGNTRGNFTVGQTAAGRKNCIEMEVYGTPKALAWNSERPNELWIGRRDGNNGIVIKDPLPLDPSARQFSDLFGGHTEGFADGLRHIRRSGTTIVRCDN
jgi:predicted dehydrogenase